MSTDELDALERIVPQDLSEWPPYAQALYLQLRRVGHQVEGLRQSVEGDDGLKDQAKDHERRIRFLEALVKWAAGIGTAILIALGTALTHGGKT